MAHSPRVGATKLRGPEPGITYSEATEAPVHGVAASAEAAPVPTAHRPPESLKAATESCLRRDEEDALGAMQDTARQQPGRAIASTGMQAAAKESPRRESQTLGRTADSVRLDQQAEGVLRLRGGANTTAPLVPAMAAAAAADSVAEEPAGGLQMPARADAAGPEAKASTLEQAPGVKRAAQEQRAKREPVSHGQPASSVAGAPLEAYLSPHMKGPAQAEQDFDQNEGPLFEQVERQVEAARSEARAAELKTGEAVQEARVWARVTTRAEEEKRGARSIMQEAHAELDRSEQLAQRAQQLQRELSAAAGQATTEPGAEAGHPPTSPATSPRSPAPCTRRGLLAAAQRLARQAANLEEEAKRQEAQAFYCVREAEQLDVLCAQKKERALGLEAGVRQLDVAADDLMASINSQLQQARRKYQEAEEKRREAAERVPQAGTTGTGSRTAGSLPAKLLEREAVQLTQQADLLAARAELRFLEAEEAVQHADTAKSALLQAQRDARMLGSRADQLVLQAETAAQAAMALMQRAAEKAEQSLAAKEAAQAAPEEDEEDAGAGPVTPTQGQQLAGELEEVQRGRAATELHAAQLLEQAQRKVQHAGQLEHTAQQSAAHVRRVLSDAAAAHAEEDAALSRAQRTGAAASRRATSRMAEQWLELVASPEWQTLAHRFPEAIARLEAAAGDEGRSEAGHGGEPDQDGNTGAGEP
ncbi:hypothetical protein ABPG77_006263 [Micractinium sp. CCAP 211/92]